jgi:putative CocE/NonD family hydrolase
LGKQSNVPVTMSDGTVLRANVYFPTDPNSGQAASGNFPVIMVQTPYGKDTVGAASGQEGDNEAATQAGPMPYFVQRGYIDVVAEVRGTGDSHGTFNLLDPSQGRDGAELVQWASKLPHSNGRVGLYGPSYMGIDQFMTANAVDKRSPLKALFPIVAGNDTYRDIAFHGGILNGEFDLAVILTIFGGLEEVNPALENPTDVIDLFQVETEHNPALLSYNLAQILNITTNGEQAYDEAYWEARAPRTMLEKIVRNRIPAYMVDGWFDVYQRGAMMNYSGFQNAFSQRSVSAPMKRGQKPTGRYQLLQGPWYHLTAGTGWDIYQLELAWFDRWLKNEKTGIDTVKRPLHVYSLGANRWIDTTHYPFIEPKAKTFWLDGGSSGSGAPSQNDGRLSTDKPKASTGADQMVYTPVTSPCARPIGQWSMGALQLALEEAKAPENPCDRDDRSIQTGPGALTYTTDPVRKSTTIAGPIDATVYATSTRPDVALVAFVEDVASDGKSYPLTSGALLGSFRALDQKRSWFAPDSRPLQPYHPYTRASVRAVPEGKVTRFDVEVFPIVAELKPGHRLRLTLNTADSPHLLPLPHQAANLAGGVYQVQRNAGNASFLEVPTASPQDFRRSKSGRRGR